MTHQEFEKKLAVLTAEGDMLRRICATRNVDDLTKVIEQEADRVKKETEELNREMYSLNDTDRKG